MDLNRTLTTLSTDETQSMEDYLWAIEQIVDSLAPIGSPVSDLDLVQLILNGVDEDYCILAATLSYGATTLTFDDLRAKLLHYE